MCVSASELNSVSAESDKFSASGINFSNQAKHCFTIYLVSVGACVREGERISVGPWTNISAGVYRSTTQILGFQKKKHLQCEQVGTVVVVVVFSH